MKTRVFKKLSAIVLVLFICVSSSVSALGLADNRDSSVKEEVIKSDELKNIDDSYIDSVTVIANKYITTNENGYFTVSDMIGLYSALRAPVADQIIKSVNTANRSIRFFESENMEIKVNNKVAYCNFKGFTQPCAIVYWWGYEIHMNFETCGDAKMMVEVQDYFPEMYAIPKT